MSMLLSELWSCCLSCIHMLYELSQGDGSEQCLLIPGREPTTEEAILTRSSLREPMCLLGLLADMDEGYLQEHWWHPEILIAEVLHMDDNLLETALWSSLSVNLPENTRYGVELYTASRCWREGRGEPHDPLTNASLHDCQKAHWLLFLFLRPQEILG